MKMSHIIKSGIAKENINTVEEEFPDLYVLIVDGEVERICTSKEKGEKAYNLYAYKFKDFKVKLLTFTAWGKNPYNPDATFWPSVIIKNNRNE